MMDMHDMGEMKDNTPTIAGENKKEKHYPTTYISTKKIPDAEDYDVGDEMELHTINKVIGKRINEDKTTELTLEMHQCGIMHKGDMKRMKELEVNRGTYNKMKSKGMA